MPQIEEVRRVVKDEQEILAQISRLSEAQYNQLLHGQSSLPKAMKSQKEANEEKEKTEALKQSKEKDLERIIQQTSQTEKDIERRKKELEEYYEQQEKRLENHSEDEKLRVDYALQKETESLKERTKIKLEAKKEFDRLDFERRKREEEAEEERAAIRKREREEDYKKMAEFERVKIESQSTLDRKAEVELADHRFQQELRMYEATKADEAKRAKDLLRVEWEYQKQINQQKLEAVLNYFSGDAGKDRAYNMVRLIGASAAVIGAVWVTVPVARRLLNRWFFAPKLVNRQQKYSRWKSLLSSNRKGPIDVVLRPNLEQRMDRILRSTQSTASRHGHYGNLLLYGRPGTGKTLWAEKLAQEAKMDFAVMSGPSFEQFETAQAIQEIRNLFDWANARRNGVLLFIDEADSFLEDRTTLHPHRVSVLNEWINQTGTESHKFMCVYETNRPEVLDPAVQSRVSASVEFETPGEKELFVMLRMYVDRYVLKPPSSGWFRSVKGISSPYLEDDSNLEEIAKRLAKEGFVGRDVSNLAINLFKAGTGSGDASVLSGEMVEEVVAEQIKKKQTEQQYLELRNQRLQDHHSKLMSAFLR